MYKIGTRVRLATSHTGTVTGYGVSLNHPFGDEMIPVYIIALDQPTAFFAYVTALEGFISSAL